MDRLELECIVRKTIANRTEISLSDADSEILVTDIAISVGQKLADETAAARKHVIAAAKNLSDLGEIIRELCEIIE
ncbi:MAG: hypothetical protein WDN47_01695 [Candidatus Doudnabacteria bacterium]